MHRSLRDTAKGLRIIGVSLTIPADREVVETYAEELETLARCEVLPPKPISSKGFHDEAGIGIFANVFKKAFPLNTDPAFEDLLIALADPERSGE